MNATYCLFVFIVLSGHVRAESSVYVSPLAKSICEDSEGFNYEARFRLIRTLGNTVSMGDMEYYLNFLERPFEAGSLRKGEFNTLKNDLADKLLMQRMHPRGIVDCFLRMVDRKALGVVWRDYVLQKLPDLYEHAEKDDRFQILEKLWVATASKEQTFSGTALLGLCRIGGIHSGTVDLNCLSERALAIVKEAKFPDQNKITALQILADFRRRETLGLARSLLNADSSVMLRVSAIGVLGRIGQSNDKDILFAYSKSSDFRLRRAAQAALKLLDG